MFHKIDSARQGLPCASRICVWPLGNWKTVRQQAITWTNVDPDLCRHRSSLGNIELITYCYPAVSDIAQVDPTVTTNTPHNRIFTDRKKLRHTAKNTNGWRAHKFSLRFHHRNLNWLNLSFRSHSYSNPPISIKVFKKTPSWQLCCCSMCQIRCDLIIRNLITTK